MPQTVTLMGPSPWGFRLVGGRDFSTPLTVSRETQPTRENNIGNVEVEATGPSVHQEIERSEHDLFQVSRAVPELLEPQDTLRDIMEIQEGDKDKDKTGLQESQTNRECAVLVEDDEVAGPSGLQGTQVFREDVVQADIEAGLQVTAGSKAALGDLCAGDTILAINGDSTETMTHMDAQNRIKNCSKQLTLSICRSGSGDRVWSPTVSDDGKISPYTEPDSLNFRPISSGFPSYQRKPSYGSEPPSPPAPVSSPTPYANNGHSRPNNGHSYTGYGNGNGHGNYNAPSPQYTAPSPQYNANQYNSPQYNAPSALYSHNGSNGSNGEKCLSNKMSGLRLSATNSPEPPMQSPGGRSEVDTQSEVYRMLQDYEEPVSQPKQSGSFKYLQGILESGDGGVSPTDRLRNLKSPIRSPVPKMGNPISSPAPGLQKLPQCTRCCNGIVGTIVKARDKLYHPDCFMCDDCNINLKKKGYFFIEESLYCEACAMGRVQAPEGYDVVAVYPNNKVQIV